MKIDKRTTNYKTGYANGLFAEKNNRKIRLMEIKNVEVLKTITVLMKNKGLVYINLDVKPQGYLRIYDVIKKSK